MIFRVQTEQHKYYAITRAAITIIYAILKIGSNHCNMKCDNKFKSNTRNVMLTSASIISITQIKTLMAIATSTTKVT